MTTKSLPVRPKLLEGWSQPEYIASGSTCDVYRVTRGNQVCALKVVDCGNDAEKYRRAVSEVLHHQRCGTSPNVVRFHRYETMQTPGGKYVFLLMDYLTPLEKHYTSRPMTVEDVVKLGIELCGALSQCEANQVAHLDIQPKNVYLGRDGHWYLGDFGSAASLTERPGLRDLRGTLSYMAPEVYQLRDYSAASDIYALGILLYSLLSGGWLPWGRQMPKEDAVRRRLEAYPIPVLDSCGISLAGLLDTACALRPQTRFTSFPEFRQKLEAALAATDPVIRRQVVNSSAVPAPKAAAAPAPKAKKLSLLGRLFGMSMPAAAAAAAPVMPAPAPVRSRSQMFTSDEDLQIFDSDGFGSTCSMEAPATQILGSDGFGTTCPMEAPATQIFGSDGFGTTCPMDAPATQIFGSDGFGTTCPMEASGASVTLGSVPIPPPQADFGSYGSVTLTPPPAPMTAPAPGYAPPPTAPSMAPPAPMTAPAPGYAPPPAPMAAPGYAPGYAPPAPNYGQPPNYGQAPAYGQPNGYPPAQPYGYPAEPGYAPGYPPQGGYGYPGQGYAPAYPGYPPQAPGYGAYPGYPGYGAPPAPRMDQVRFSALAPKGVERDAMFETQIFMYQETFRQVVDEAIAQAEAPVQEKETGFHKVREGAQVKIAFSAPELNVYDEDCQVWSGGYLTFQFFTFLPQGYAKKQVLLKAMVYFDDVPATRLMLTVNVQAQQNVPVQVQRQDILSAFVSYASQDRGRVASLIQGMSKARPDLDIFFDVNSLTSGQRWEERLYKEIDARDILFLCWSTNAKSSPWVEREWRYALQTKGVDCIEPIPLEQPDLCPPPEELSSKHFNDTLLYIINR